MNQRYAELFSIDCTHSYFADQIAHPVCFAPSTDCVTLLKRYRLLIRQRSGGCSVYYDQADTLKLLSVFNETMPFNFLLTSNDANLFNYTDRPVGPAPGVTANMAMFDNRQDFPGGELHPAGSPFFSVLPRHAGFFTESLPQPVTGATASLLGGLDWQPLWQSQTPDQAQTVVAVDTTGLPDGRYRLVVAQLDAVELCLCRNDAASAWGMVSIFAGGPAQAAHLPVDAYPIGVDGQVSLKRYAIVLDSLSTIWRYYLLDTQTSAPHGGGSVQVIDRRKPPAAGNGISFSALPQTIAVNGVPATVYESDGLLPLRQRPGTDLQLTYRAASQGGLGNGAVSRRDMPLPYPTPGALAFDRDQPQRLRSDMYVYL